MAFELISLFCGAGGLDTGFSAAGFKTAVALDNCTSAVRSFNANGADVALESDLSRLSIDAFLALIPRDSDPVGLIGGPPCQGFSRGNVWADHDDPRNRLPFRYADLLAAANQKFRLHFFVFENVAGLLAGKHAIRFGLIRRRLRDAGFNVAEFQLDAQDYSVPQRRKRLPP